MRTFKAKKEAVKTELLSRLRERAGITQEEAARRIGILRATLAKWETGDSQPKASILPTIARVYGVKTIDELYTDEERNG